ncbi:MAG: DUF2007 domain-containing protein [Anaerolineales bacterium]|nr:DUF2007 domain-containing protein [Anaerolineales bacterium]
MSSEKWARAASVYGDLQAELLRGLLEAQEIPVLLSREGAGRALGLTVGPLGEIKILVPGKNLEAALSIVSQYQSGEFEDLGEDDPPG